MISIHALLAESDGGDVHVYSPTDISIHALLAESDKLRNPIRPGKINFYPRSPCGERLVTVGPLMFNLYFYPRSPCGERQPPLIVSAKPPYFYPRSPCGERRGPKLGQLFRALISIHALLAESDIAHLNYDIVAPNFYPRSPCGERPASRYTIRSFGQFLSTLSLRRATRLMYFLPFGRLFLSTLSLRRATTEIWPVIAEITISIHALLAESDSILDYFSAVMRQFLSTLSLRRATFVTLSALAPEEFLSTLSLRRATQPVIMHTWRKTFLSTLSLRRATSSVNTADLEARFLSTLSLRRATVHYDNYNLHCVISIHALLAESDSEHCER